MQVTERPEAPPVSAPKTALYDLVIVGGCGHVGLPMALAFAKAGATVGIYDTDFRKVQCVADGRMPFLEEGGEELLKTVLRSGRLTLSDDASVLAATDNVVLVIGTPIDEFMYPSTQLFERAVDDIAPHVRPNTLVILRSTVYPGTTEMVEFRLRSRGLDVHVVCCPERVAEGHALEEIRTLPQLVGASDDVAFQRAKRIFEALNVKIVRTSPKEAELAKLLTNTWRYMKFAIANQFFQIVHHAGLDHGRILEAIRHEYPRAQDLPGPGFAAGPCLLKDTMQLAAFSPDHFPMGHAAMLINEGLPGYIVDALQSRCSLKGRKVGILGMAFKGDSDDPRTSLSYKLRKHLTFAGAHVLCSDPYVSDPRLVPLETVLEEAELLVIGAPHKVYRSLMADQKQIVDIWGITGKGIRL